MINSKPVTSDTTSRVLSRIDERAGVIERAGDGRGPRKQLMEAKTDQAYWSSVAPLQLLRADYKAYRSGAVRGRQLLPSPRLPRGTWLVCILVPRQACWARGATRDAWRVARGAALAHAATQACHVASHGGDGIVGGVRQVRHLVRAASRRAAAAEARRPARGQPDDPRSMLPSRPPSASPTAARRPWCCLAATARHVRVCPPAPQAMLAYCAKEEILLLVVNSAASAMRAPRQDECNTSWLNCSISPAFREGSGKVEQINSAMKYLIISTWSRRQ